MTIYETDPRNVAKEGFDYCYYTAGLYSRASGDGSCAFVQTAGGNPLNTQARKIDDATLQLAQIVAIIRAVRNVPSGKTALIYTGSQEAILALKRKTCNPRLVLYYEDSSRDKDICVAFFPRNLGDPYMSMARNIAKATLYGLSADITVTEKPDRILTTQEYAFFKGLENLLRNFATDLDGATFTIRGEDFDLPRVANGDDLIELATTVKLQRLYPEPKFGIGDRVLLDCHWPDGESLEDVTGRIGIIADISEIKPRNAGISRFCYQVNDENGTPIIDCNETHLKFPDPQ